MRLVICFPYRSACCPPGQQRDEDVPVEPAAQAWRHDRKDRFSASLAGASDPIRQDADHLHDVDHFLLDAPAFTGMAALPILLRDGIQQVQELAPRVFELFPNSFKSGGLSICHLKIPRISFEIEMF